MILSTTNQVLSAVRAFSDFYLKTFRGARAHFYMAKDKPPKKVADNKGCSMLIKDLRRHGLGDFRNRNSKIHQFRYNLFYPMITFQEATSLIKEGQNCSECGQDPPASSRQYGYLWISLG